MRNAILFEDNHLLAVAKRAGDLSQPDGTGDASLVEILKEHRRRAEGKPGNVYLGALHRLDRPVTGVLLFAKTSKAAGRLAAQFRAGSVRKTYLALTDRCDGPPEGVWRDRLVKDRDRNRSRVALGAEGKPAETRWRRLATDARHTLWELNPLTGRSHQLRVHLSHHARPILGDLKYGAAAALPDRSIALHALRLVVAHPVGGADLAIECPLPDAWPPVPSEPEA